MIHVLSLLRNITDGRQWMTLTVLSLSLELILSVSLSLSVSLYYLIYLLPLPLCLSPFKCCPVRRPNIYQLKLNIAEGEDTFEIEHFRDGAIIPFLY